MADSLFAGSEVLQCPINVPLRRAVSKSALHRHMPLSVDLVLH